MASLLKPLETAPLGDRAYEAIKDAIVRVELRPGATLKDRELADALGLSRTPVREALHRLVGVGLVGAPGRGGWVVTPFTEKDVRELFELRRLLEPAGLEQLEREPDDVALKRIATFFDGYSAPLDPDEYPAYFEHDHSFHSFLVACSGNDRLIDFYAVLSSHIRRGRHYLSTYVGGHRLDQTLTEHRAVSQAVVSGDFAQAREALIQHLRTGEERMMELMRRKMAADEAGT